MPIDFSLLTAGSVLFDAVYLPGGDASVQILMGDAKALGFVQEGFLHCKTIAATDAGVRLLLAAHPGQDKRSESHAEAVIQNPTALLASDSGILVGRGAKIGPLAEKFIKAVAQHRHWDRELKGQVPA